MTSLYTLAEHALPADALCGLDESECASVDRIARAVEASGYGEATAHRTAILRAIGEHLRAYTDACEALRWLASLDHRLATWGACACARGALRYVKDGEHWSLRAIETTERWLAGQATLDEVRESRHGAWAAWSATADAACAAAAYAAYVTHGAIYSVTCSGASAAYAATAYAATAARRSAAAWDAARNAELTRLVGVVADALPGLPPEVIA